MLAGLGIFVATVFLATIALFVIMRVTDPLHVSLGVLLAQLAVNAAGALLAGFATGRMTWARSLYTLFVLALIVAMSSLIPVLKGSPSADPQWYLLARPLVILLGVLAGGVMERRRASAVLLPV